MNSDERAAIADEVRRTVRDIPDFPKPGILFRDITPVLANPSLFMAFPQRTMVNGSGSGSAELRGPSST